MAVDTPHKDSMKSTWRQDPKQWTFDHHVFNTLNLFHYDIGKDIPVHAKTDGVPKLSEWSLHLWIVSHALWPVAIQWLYFRYAGHNLPPIAAYLLYFIAYQANAAAQIQVLRGLGHRFGFLDGDKHDRDEVPDNGVHKAMISLVATMSARPMFSLALAYNSAKAPEFSWWLPVEIGLYGIAVDFYFYLYHRACHEISTLWRYHRTHHLTKHPNPMLAGYSDTEQEIIEIALVPILAWLTMRLLGFPMGYYDWWICQEYVTFSEIFGHSGLRMYAVPPSTNSWLLELMGCELIIEDHDIHHRNGWRKAHNYGKQTRVWDRLFGTCGPRYETDLTKNNLTEVVNFPLY